MKLKSGVSVYIGLSDYSLSENIAYLKKAKSLGIDYCFTSAHMPETSNVDDLETIIKVTGELNIKLIIDVSKPMMKNFIMPANLYALRLDWGFTDDDIVQMSREASCKIELNASTLNGDKLRCLIDKGLNLSNVRVSHNFYPKTHTGLALEVIKEKNESYHQYGLTVMAYLPSQHGKRPPLYDGLPTVERHRNLPLEIAIGELVLAGVDEIFFGDAFASTEEITKLTSYDASVISIPIKLREDLSVDEVAILSKKHRSRIDESPVMVRSSMSRGELVPFRDSKQSLNKLDIILDNENYLRYQGELGILKQSIPYDSRFNIVAKVLTDAEQLLLMIPAGSYFKFTF